jgi:transglutaminase-like putative cysteine protease
MRLKLSYHTRYTYDRPVYAGLTAIRLVPSPRRGLRVLSTQLTVAPGRHTGTYVDGWGTRVDLIEVHARHARSETEVVAEVETLAEEDGLPLAPEERLLFSRDSPRVRRAAASSLGWNVGSEGQTWNAVEAALAWFPQRFVYSRGETDARTEVEDFLQRGAGVCQDFVHAFLALLRGWGWCARYVSGYCFNAPAEAGSIEAEASHAWVEVYRPGIGWIALDPTAGTYADERYVVVGAGRDYDDVRPVRGILHGGGTQEHVSRLRMQVAQQQ